MWSRLMRRLRGRSPKQLDFSAVDRLDELVARIVALLPDEESPQAVAPPEVPAVAPERAVAAATLLFVPAPSGYSLAEAEGVAVARGERIVLSEGAFRVLRFGPSPLPGDARRCAFLEREEPSAAERTPDA